MNRFAWLMRREIWEHRAIWMAPGVVLALLLLGAVTGNIFMGNVHVGADISIGDDTSSESGLSQEDLEEIQRDLARRYPMEGRSVVIFRDQRGEIGRFLVEGSRWSFRGEQ
jgi:hypothetical protein